MLGSVHDADDALQDTLVRAWRGVDGLREGSSARSWLYRIATNVCLTEIARRRTRVLPQDFGPAAERGTPPGAPVTETVWLEPYPDQAMGLPDGRAVPEATYLQREAVELAFVAALQHLTGSQRAVLLLREVMGFSAEETASLLSTTVASVNSALQRARATIADRVPERTQQQTLRSLGDQELNDLVRRYVNAWERCDIEAFAALLAEHASFAMPPLSTWYAPREAVVAWARDFALDGAWRWRTVRTTANGQPALAFYTWDEPHGAYLPFAMNVLTLAGDAVSSVTAFIVRVADAPEPDAYIRFPDQAIDGQRLVGAFRRFGVPDRLPPD